MALAGITHSVTLYGHYMVLFRNKALRGQQLKCHREGDILQLGQTDNSIFLSSSEVNLHRPCRFHSIIYSDMSQMYNGMTEACILDRPQG